MANRKGMGAGKGKGFKNIIPGQDPKTHSNSAKGIKQPQFSDDRLKRISKGVEQRAKDIEKKRENLSKKLQDRKTQLEKQAVLKEKERQEIAVIRQQLVELRTLNESELEKRAKEFASKTGAFLVKEAKVVGEFVKEKAPIVAEKAGELAVATGKKVGELAKEVGKETLEFAREKLQEAREKKRATRIRELKEIDHPLAGQVDKQQLRVAEIKQQLAINEEDDRPDREERLLDELATEENQLRELQEQATNLHLEELSDAELNTLAIRYQPSVARGFIADFTGLGGGNPYQTELTRRITKRKEVADAVKDTRKSVRESAGSDPIGGFIGDFFKG